MGKRAVGWGMAHRHREKDTRIHRWESVHGDRDQGRERRRIRNTALG